MQDKVEISNLKKEIEEDQVEKAEQYTKIKSLDNYIDELQKMAKEKEDEHKNTLKSTYTELSSLRTKTQQFEKAQKTIAQNQQEKLQLRAQINELKQ